MTKHMTEEQMARDVVYARNILLIAASEMPEEGDHRPAINATINSIGRDWQDYTTLKNVDAELEEHLGNQLNVWEKGLSKCTADVQTELAPELRQLREIYDAYFSPLDPTAISIESDDVPLHAKRFAEIAKTLQDPNADVFGDSDRLMSRVTNTISMLEPTVANKYAARAHMMSSFKAVAQKVNKVGATLEMNVASTEFFDVREAAMHFVAGREANFDMAPDYVPRNASLESLAKKPQPPALKSAITPVRPGKKSLSDLARIAAGEPSSPKPR